MFTTWPMLIRMALRTTVVLCCMDGQIRSSQPSKVQSWSFNVQLTVMAAALSLYVLQNFWCIMNLLTNHVRCIIHIKTDWETKWPIPWWLKCIQEIPCGGVWLLSFPSSGHLDHDHTCLGWIGDDIFSLYMVFYSIPQSTSGTYSSARNPSELSYHWITTDQWNTSCGDY